MIVGILALAGVILESGSVMTDLGNVGAMKAVDLQHEASLAC